MGAVCMSETKRRHDEEDMFGSGSESVDFWMQNLFCKLILYSRGISTFETMSEADIARSRLSAEKTHKHVEECQAVSARQSWVRPNFSCCSLWKIGNFHHSGRWQHPWFMSMPADYAGVKACVRLDSAPLVKAVDAWHGFRGYPMGTDQYDMKELSRK